VGWAQARHPHRPALCLCDSLRQKLLVPVGRVHLHRGRPLFHRKLAISGASQILSSSNISTLPRRLGTRTAWVTLRYEGVAHERRKEQPPGNRNGGIARGWQAMDPRAVTQARQIRAAWQRDRSRCCDRFAIMGVACSGYAWLASVYCSLSELVLAIRFI
jgi:hypothetical protein